MAKAELKPTKAPEVPQVPEEDLSPMQRWERDWDQKPQMRLLVTKLGRVRGGLGVSDNEKARKLISDYGI